MPVANRRAPHGDLSPMTPDQLKHARLRLGLKQSELGAALGIGPKEISKKEIGERPVTKVQALAIRGMLLESALRAAGGDPDKLIT